MPPRASWKGFIRLSLVTVPVQAHTASTTGGGTISLNQLHEPCHNRIRYQKTCPIHGEVPNDEIVKGYEYAKGQYVIIDPDELDRLRRESDKSIGIDRFAPLTSVDANYFSGRAYYLTPDGVAGQKPYSLLRRAMSDGNLCCVGGVVLFGKEQLVLIRPVDDLLCMNLLEYHSHLRQPAEFRDAVQDGEFTKEEMNLTRMLVDASTADDPQLEDYKDLYTERLTELVQAKVEGKEIVAVPEEEAPEVINLMDALKASVEQAKQKTGSTDKRGERAAPRKKMAASEKQRKTARKRKKTG